MPKPGQTHTLTLSAADARKLAEKIKKKGGKDLKAVTQNLVDRVWAKGKPSRPNEPVIVLDLQYAGKGIGEKVEDVRKELEKKKSSGFLVCMLHNLASRLQIRKLTKISYAR